MYFQLHVANQKLISDQVNNCSIKYWKLSIRKTCKKDITLLLTHWSYVFLALNHQNVVNEKVPRKFSWDTYISGHHRNGPTRLYPRTPWARSWDSRSQGRTWWGRGNLEHKRHINGLMQERRNSSALAMELHLSCINSSAWHSSAFSWIEMFSKGACHAAAIAGPTILVPCDVVMSLQWVWRSGNSVEIFKWVAMTWHLERVPDSSPRNRRPGDMP